MGRGLPARGKECTARQPKEGAKRLGAKLYRAAGEIEEGDGAVSA